MGEILIKIKTRDKKKFTKKIHGGGGGNFPGGNFPGGIFPRTIKRNGYRLMF